MRLTPAILRAFNDSTTARGPGVNADQADSLIDILAGAPLRTNPPTDAPNDTDLRAVSHEVLDEKSDAVVEATGEHEPGMVRGQCMEIAALITGEFIGGRIVPGSKTSSGNALRLSPSFEGRMEQLVHLITQHIDRLGSRGSWPRALNKLRAAAAFALKSRELLSNGKPFGLSWGILAENGNKKLPFMAYSELPLVTCPGAGACAVWCYSLKAWRYPEAFVRQCLNTLAGQFDAYLGGESKRQWPTYVTAMVAFRSKRIRKHKTCFFRLFVDGDFFDKAAVVMWHEALKHVGPGVLGSSYGVEAYGYSKCWHFFVDLAKSGYQFAPNYVVNASSGSKYATNEVLKTQMLNLDICRGEFKAVDIDAHFKELASVVKGGQIIPNMSDAAARKRVERFVEINGIDNPDTAFEAANFIADKYKLSKFDLKGSHKRDLARVRGTIFKAWIEELAADKTVYLRAAEDLAKDQGVSVDKAVIGKKALGDKILAQNLHEVLWAYGLGGACPLVCGNCSDVFEPTATNPGVHRCAAKPGSLFWKKSIHIGLH